MNTRSDGVVKRKELTRDQQIKEMMERHCPGKRGAYISERQIIVEEIVSKVFEFGIGILLAALGHPFIGIGISAYLLLMHGAARHPERIGERFDVANMPSFFLRNR